MTLEVSEREAEILRDLRAVIRHGHGEISAIKVADHKIMNWNQTFNKR
jgi:hypothetical protein